MSWSGVRRWRERLRALDPAPLAPELSAAGAREAWTASLDALDDEALDAVEALGGRAFSSAVVVSAATVFTAPLEWLAVLLGRGTAVTLKHPHAHPETARALQQTAGELPLYITAERDAVSSAPLVVVMGADQTVREVRAAIAPQARLLPHGHRVSVAWVPEDRDQDWEALAADVAMYDTRGCLSPAVVFTPLPLERAVPQLARAMARAQQRWPLGRLSAAEGARLRERDALTRVLGELQTGEGWSVHGLPSAQMTPAALPRAPTVVSASLAEAVQLVAGLPLSTVGTPGPAEPWLAAGATRTCALGYMQRPPLVRTHDGEDWLRATALWPSVEPQRH